MDEYLAVKNEIICNGKCKCCLGETELQNIWKQHKFEGKNVNYGQMLNECFGISWEPSNTAEWICNICVSRLGDAMAFKQEILITQDILQDDLYINIKVEDGEDSASQEGNYEEVEYLEDEPEYELEINIPSSSQVSTPKRRKPKYPPKLPRHRRNKTYKQYTKNVLYEAVQSVLSGDMECTEAARSYGIPKGTLQAKVNESMDTKEDEPKGSNNDKHYKLIEDIQTILKYTNAIPFRTRAMNRYYCFYCPTNGRFFEDPDELRSHTHTKHRNNKIYSIELLMRPQWMNEVIKLDVKDLHCIQCRTPLPDWNDMFVHFAETHHIGFDEAYTKIIPYALTSDLNCVLCHDSFHNFGHLDAHMNEHYSNYICYECGDTFLAANRLDKHLTVHKVGSFPCKLCDKEFKLERYLAKHCALVHRQERKCKCLYCDEKFVDQFNRHKHVTEAHKDKVKTITCEVCGRVFTWKSYYVAHVRKRHSGVKNHKCPHCSKAFLMRHELVNHLVVHTGVRNYVCLCGESFKRANDLRRHVQLEHEEEMTIIGE
nr:zinc finger and BTB domain-containing protein 17-like [Maniola hyperantus]